MSKFEKATDFYLRGFSSQYIKRRTNFSKQALLKQLSLSGVHYTKQDIVQYQINYIRERFTHAVVEQAFSEMWSTYSDPYKTSRSQRVILLGCGFGDFKRVLTAVLGEQAYQTIQKELNRQNKITI